ncbi:MAG: hypothetical protein ACO3S6_06295, partial [Aquiluna sp.]
MSGLDPNASATVTVTSTRDFYASGSSSLTSSALPPAIGPALNPVFGSATATVDGFSLPITNYNGFWSWSATASNPDAIVAISAAGIVTVTGLAAGESSTVTVETTRSNYSDGSATSGSISSLQEALTPTFGSVVVGSEGYTLPISNFDPEFTWTVEAPLGGTASIDTESESVVLTGLTAGQRGMVIVTTERSGYVDGQAAFVGSAEQPGRTP